MKRSMKNVQYFLACLVCALIFSVASQAQEAEKPSAGGNGERMTEQMVQTLQLDESQRQQVSVINAEMVTKMKAVKDSHAEDREKARAEVKALRDEHDKKMKEVLTDDQYKKYLELQAQRKENMQKKRGKMKGAQPAE